MEEDLVLDLEDGEIEDILGNDEPPDEVYVPLERPSQPPLTRIQPVVTHSDSASEASSDSDTESDSSSRGRLKRKPKKIYRDTNVAAAGGPARKKSYSIWCNDAAEDNLSNNMVNCNVNRKADHSRDVESYDPGLLFKTTKNVSNKRNHGGAHVGIPAKMSSTKHHKKEQINLESKILLPLTKNETDPVDVLAEEIAAKLTEDKQSVIENAIQVLGKEKAIELYQETVQIERNGGLLVMNGARRRTPGGVYFHQLKYSHDLTPDQIREIFKDDKRQTAREIKKSKSAQRKEAISKEDYPTLLSRAEAAIFKKKQIETDDAEEVKNPPPSPATDGRENSNSSCDIDQSKNNEEDVMDM